MRFRRTPTLAVAAAVVVATAAISYAAASSSGGSPSTTSSVATGGLPVIYADPGFGGAITKADAEGGSVEIHFLNGGEHLTLTVTQSPWSTWGQNVLYAVSGTVSGGVGNVTGIGTLAGDNNTFAHNGSTRYAACMTFQKGSTATSIHYTSERGWYVARYPEPPCPAPGD